MESSFLLVLRKHPEPQRSTLAQSAGDARGETGDPVTSRRRSWSSDDGRIRAEFIAGDGAPESDGYHVGSTGSLTLVAGHLRRGGERWGAPSSWAARLAQTATTSSVGDLREDLRGIFAATHLSRGGDGWVITDPLGMRCLYVGEDRNQWVVATRAELVAETLSPTGVPQRAQRSGAWLAFGSYHVGTSTGYADVEVVPPGSWLRISAGNPSWETQQWPRRAIGAPPVTAGELSDLAELVIDDVADSLAAALEHPADRHIINLTGGKDSRMVLAAALKAGLAEEFEYQTTGPPGLPDVEIASELTARLGLRHEVTFLGLKSPIPYEVRARQFIAASAALVNVADMDAPTPDREVRVTGVGGEMLRCFAKVPEDRDVDGRMDLAVRNSRFGRLGLVRPEVSEQLDAELRQRWDTIPTPSASPLDRIHAYFTGNLLRFTRLGPQREIHAGLRLVPLYSIVNLRAAVALGGLDRQSEVLFADVMRQSSDVLVDHRFTGAGWDERAQARLGPRPTPTTSPPAVPRGEERPASRAGEGSQAPPPAEPKAASLGQLLGRAPSDERTALLGEAFADPSNPVWEVLDRAAAQTALAGWSSLDVLERRELLGAGTAALWMEDSPTG